MRNQKLLASVVIVVGALGGCASPAPDLSTESGVTKAAYSACRDQDPRGGYFECTERFKLAHQQWNRDCRLRTISAANSDSGRDEFSPWCIITANHAFFAQVIVEKERTYFRSLRDFSHSCERSPAIVVDGARIKADEDVVEAFQRGVTARIQQQEPWPDCSLGGETAISLEGLRAEIAGAERWVEAQHPGDR